MTSGTPPRPPRPPRTGASRVVSPRSAPKRPARAEAEPANLPAPRPTSRSGAGSAVDSSRERDRRPPRGTSQTPAPDQIQLREREKKRARSNLLRRRVLAAVAVLAGVALAAWVVFYSPALAVRPGRVTVTAQSDAVETEEAQSVADEWVGTPLPRLSTAAIAAAIEKDPRIQSAQVRRDWPAGLSVLLVAREPAVSAPMSGDYAVLGADAVVIRTVAQPPAELLLVRAAGAEALTADQVADVLAVENALPEELRAQVASVQVDGVGISLLLKGGSKITWGDAADSDTKARVLALLMEQRPSQAYNVSDPARPSAN